MAGPLGPLTTTPSPHSPSSCSHHWEPETPASWSVCWDPVLRQRRRTECGFRSLRASPSTARDAQPLAGSFSGNCLPGTTLGDAKGTAWPESCWSLVTWAREQDQRLEGAIQEGVSQAMGHSPLQGSLLHTDPEQRNPVDEKGVVQSDHSLSLPQTPKFLIPLHPPPRSSLTWLAERRTVPRERLG